MCGILTTSDPLISCPVKLLERRVDFSACGSVRWKVSRCIEDRNRPSAQLKGYHSKQLQKNLLCVAHKRLYDFNEAGVFRVKSLRGASARASAREVAGHAKRVFSDRCVTPEPIVLRWQNQPRIRIFLSA